MMTNKLLIITNKGDITVDCIVDLLNERKINYYRLNTEEIGRSIDIEIDIKRNQWVLTDNIKNLTLSLSDFDSIYYRRPELALPPNELNYSERVFFKNEHMSLLEGIYKFLSGKKWLNNVYSIRRAENKIFQLSLAYKIGFNIPETIITNLAHKAKNFICKNKTSIFKPIRTGLIEESDSSSKVLYTSRIDKNYIENIESIKSLPTYFQNEIIKQSDIRVTIVGDQCFSAEIDSQFNNATKVDWRKSSSILPHKTIKLPRRIKEKCILLCEYLNLNFAAVDLIKDLKNNYWFLEINPNGQWAWIEKILGYPISESIVNYLTSIQFSKV